MGRFVVGRAGPAYGLFRHKDGGWPIWRGAGFELGPHGITVKNHRRTGQVPTSSAIDQNTAASFMKRVWAGTTLQRFGDSRMSAGDHWSFPGFDRPRAFITGPDDYVDGVIRGIVTPARDDFQN